MFTGIVEELGTVEAVERQSDAVRLTVRAATALEDTRPGDSISVNGCCLTVAERADATWTADVMAETLRRTTLGFREPGDSVNLEVDVIGKYVARQLGLRVGTEVSA